MSDKNNDYLNLSVEISNEIGDRMINQSKLKLENTKESIIRNINDNKLYDEIDKRTSIINDELKNISERLNLLESKKVIENTKQEEPINEVKEEKDIESITDVLIKTKDDEIKQNENKIDNIVVKLNDKIIEQKKIEETNGDSDKVKNEISKMVIDVDTLNKKIEETKIDKEIIIKSGEEFIKSQQLEIIKKYDEELKNEIELFNIVFEDYEETYESNIELIGKFNVINYNIKNILNSELFFEQINEISNKIIFLKNKVDIEKLFIKKMLFSNQNILSQLREIEMDNFESLEDIIEYQQKIIDNQNKIKDNNSSLVEKNKESKNLNIELKKLTDEIDYIYKKIIEDNETTNSLRYEINKLKESLKK